VEQTRPATRHKEQIKMAKLTVKFKVEVNGNETVNFEYRLQDLLKTSVLPALSAELIPLTLEVKKGRN
jgi:hypothetical protein